MLPHCNSVNKTIYINPNFGAKVPENTVASGVALQAQAVIPRNAHINPLFLKSQNPRHTIYMNPIFLQNMQQQHLMQLEQQDKESHIPATESHVFVANKDNKIPGNSFPNNFTESRKIICNSKNRLIREPLINKEDDKSERLLKTVVTQPPFLVLNKRKLVRKSSAGTVPIKKELRFSEDSKVSVTKYRLDNRVMENKVPFPPTPKIKRTYVGQYALSRNSLSLSTNTTAIKRSLAINKTINKKLQVVNINGLLYKSTQNSLRLKDIAKVPVSSNTISNLFKTSAARQKALPNTLKSIQGLTIFVRGIKYVMDANKFKLTRVSNSELTPTNISQNNCKVLKCRRIDIGGYTYKSVNSAKNILIRTTNHLSRAYVYNAKYKSLQTLTKRMVKTNIPCPIYQRIGKCAAYDRRKCYKVHNKLQVVVCSRFLRGECDNSNCLLSHNISLSKMPVCKFFLQGVCVRNDCPYLHKKLSNKAELCIDFQRGFCQLADKCHKRHEFVCHENERNNVCSTKNGAYCSVKRRNELQVEKKVEKLGNENVTATKAVSSALNSSAVIEDNLSSKRYFIKPCGKDKITEDIIESSSQFANEVVDNIVDCVEENTQTIRKCRPKLGALPSYIPL